MYFKNHRINVVLTTSFLLSGCMVQQPPSIALVPDTTYVMQIERVCAIIVGNEGKEKNRQRDLVRCRGDRYKEYILRQEKMATRKQLVTNVLSAALIGVAGRILVEKIKE